MTENGNLRVRELVTNIRAELAELEQMLDVDQTLSCTEAARYLGVAKGTISRYISIGKLRKIKRGGRVGISLSELARMKRAMRG